MQTPHIKRQASQGASHHQHGACGGLVMSPTDVQDRVAFGDQGALFLHGLSRSSHGYGEVALDPVAKARFTFGLEAEIAHAPPRQDLQVELFG